MKNKGTAIEVRREMHTPAQLFLRESGEGNNPSRTIAGYAILFNTPSAPLWDDEEEEVREIISPEAITEDFLSRQDIKMTMFHNDQLILARSNNGEGTLHYSVDEKGVAFEFEAPNTTDGDKAIELVKRGDISGCSFIFVTRYYDGDFVNRSNTTDETGKNHITYTVRSILGIYDFTLTANPAYPDTSVETRSLRELLSEDEKKKEEQRRAAEEQEKAKAEARQKQIAAMRAEESKTII